MENELPRSCARCRNVLKKQKLGLNVVYYCPRCGSITSADFI
ncbi:Transcription factor zinc-finger [Methanolobus vulcani]|uniref:Transcription factor zinc-finger n=1 Tax=Methanolobus vulcani TaxID=38026 RepID=A0A7Z7AWT1_9EURY|nr:zinc finger domain-containing protein [Methanolobus vulcani]SDF87374.1 Transcription factor zinc-finger [Methanolobus vulcani]